MKKHLTLNSIFVISLLVASMAAKAELPALTTSSPSSLPATVSSSETSKYIDVDGDGIVDLGFYFSGSGSLGQSIISMYNSGLVYVEWEGNEYTAPQSANVPLQVSSSGSSGYYTSFLNQGTLIPNDLPSGIQGNNWGKVSDNIIYLPDAAPLTSSSYDGETEGYVGVYFSGASGYMYGWLNVSINGGGSSATINSVGAGTGPGSAVAAGYGDPFAVPFPLIASVLGFALVGGGIWFKRKRQN